jgi:hypothetical protein
MRFLRAPANIVRNEQSAVIVTPEVSMPDTTEEKSLPLTPNQIIRAAKRFKSWQMKHDYKIREVQDLMGGIRLGTIYEFKNKHIASRKTVELIADIMNISFTQLADPPVLDANGKVKPIRQVKKKDSFLLPIRFTRNQLMTMGRLGVMLKSLKDGDKKTSAINGQCRKVGKVVASIIGGTYSTLEAFEKGISRCNATRSRQLHPKYKSVRRIRPRTAADLRRIKRQAESFARRRHAPPPEISDSDVSELRR